MKERNKLVLIGNGFDLAHGLKTSYKNFLDWYMCDSFQRFCDNKGHKDALIEVKNKYSGMLLEFKQKPTTFEDVLSFISINDYQSITYHSKFFQSILDLFKNSNWVDIEIYYFKMLKAYFINPNLIKKEEVVEKLNSEFDFLITKLADYNYSN